jgi:hypothetical protein
MYNRCTRRTDTQVQLISSVLFKPLTPQVHGKLSSLLNTMCVTDAGNGTSWWCKSFLEDQRTNRLGIFRTKIKFRSAV